MKRSFTILVLVAVLGVLFVGCSASLEIDPQGQSQPADQLS